MNEPKQIYTAHFVPYEGIYMTCGEEWPSSRELDGVEFVTLEEYNELKFILDGLEK